MRLVRVIEEVRGQMATFIKANSVLVNHSGLQGMDYASSGHTGFASSAGLTAHTGDATIHFLESSIDHVNISNIGSNAHSVIDTHLASTSNPHTTTLEQAIAGGATATSTPAFNNSTAITHSATTTSFKFTSNTVLGPVVPSKAFEFKSANVSQADYHTLWTDTNDAALLRLGAAGVLTFAGDADDEYIHEKRAARPTASWTPQSGTWDFTLATVIGLGAGSSDSSKNYLGVGDSFTIAASSRIIACDYYELRAGSDLTIGADSVLCVA